MEAWFTIQRIWEDKPEVFLFSALGLVLFVYLVIDAWRLRHKSGSVRRDIPRPLP
jgi:hypothetical protein